MREHRIFKRLAALAAGVAMLATGGIVTATANAAESKPAAEAGSCVWGETADGLPKVCWLDMSDFNGQTSWDGSAVEGHMGMSIGNGYKLSFDTKTTGRKVEATAVPTWTDKETDHPKSWFGREGYTGFGDAKLALYQPTVRKGSSLDTTTIELTNISLTHNGQKVTGDWSLVMGDGESSNEDEAIAYRAMPDPVSECATLPATEEFKCNLKSENGWMVAYGDPMSGSVDGVPYTTIAKAKTPTSVSVQLRASSHSSRQAIVFGVQFVTATAKQVTDSDYENPVPGVGADATVSADGFGTAKAEDGDAVLPIIASGKQVDVTYGLEAKDEQSKDFAKWYQVCYTDNGGSEKCDDKYGEPVALDADSNASHTRKFTLKGITPTLNGVKNLTVTPAGSQLDESQRIDRTFRFDIKRTDTNNAQVKYQSTDGKTNGDIKSGESLEDAAEATVKAGEPSADISLPKLFFQRDPDKALTYTFDITEQKSEDDAYKNVTFDTAEHILTVNVDMDGSVTYSMKNDGTEQANGKIEFNNTIEAKTLTVRFTNPKNTEDMYFQGVTAKDANGNDFASYVKALGRTPVDPDGGVFDHWARLDNDGQFVEMKDADEVSDFADNYVLDVYALFKDAPAPEDANVNFIDTLDNGQTGRIIGTRIYKVGATLSEWPTDLEMPVHEGYEFAGWSLDKDGKTTVEPREVTVPAQGVDLYAVWKRQTPQPVSEFRIAYYDQDSDTPLAESTDYKAGDQIADEQGGWLVKPEATNHPDSKFLGYRYRVEGNASEPLAKPSDVKDKPDGAILAGEDGKVTKEFAKAHDGETLMLEAVWRKAEPAKANAGDSLKVVKKLTGDPATRSFEFVLKDRKGDQAATTGRQEVTTGEEGTFPLEGTLEFASSGEHKYTLLEVDDGQPGVSYDHNQYTVRYVVRYDQAANKLEVAEGPTITDKDGKRVEAPVAFNNGYKASAATLDLADALKGTKTLKGDPWRGEFTFGLYETEGGRTASEALDTANVDADTDGKPEGGVFAWHFDKTLTFDEPGVREYVVKEHNDGVEGMDYDNTQYKVVVNVVDNGKTGGLVPQVTIERDGAKVDSLDFTNTYAEPTVPPTPDPDPDPDPMPEPDPDPDPTPVPPACSEPFVDVDETTPHYAEIEWVYCNRIAEGWKEADGTVTYRPLSEVTRQDYAAFLYRLAGRPDWTPSREDFRFSDVTRFTPHYREILWASSHGYITGYPDGTFQGMAPIQRQDAVQMLWRLAGSPEPRDVSDNFTDAALTPFAKALAWAKETGVSVGFPNPDGTASFGVGKTIIRQDMAFFLKNAKATIG